MGGRAYFIDNPNVRKSPIKNVSFDAETLPRYEKYAKELGLSFSALVRVALGEYYVNHYRGADYGKGQV